jgi:hypothetical protein
MAKPLTGQVGSRSVPPRSGCEAKVPGKRRLLEVPAPATEHALDHFGRRTQLGRDMEPLAADLKSSGRMGCSPQQWEFVCSYSVYGAICKYQAFCGNTTANLTRSPQATKWLT